MTALPHHLADVEGWHEIPGLGWMRVWEHQPYEDEHGVEIPGPDFWWWHDCPPVAGKPGWLSPRTIDVSSGARHAITGGSLEGGDLTIHGGSGSIPCEKCGLHGWVRNGQWVAA